MLPLWIIDLSRDSQAQGYIRAKLEALPGANESWRYTTYSDIDFNRICNMLTEYGSLEQTSGIALAFLEEHCETLIVGNAVQTLATL